MKSDGGQGASLRRAGGADYGCEAGRNRTESKGFHSEVGEKSGTTKKYYYDRCLCVGASHW